MNSKILTMGIFFIVLLCEENLVQAESPVWPYTAYGGVQDTSRYTAEMEHLLKQMITRVPPLNFTKRANFGGAFFDSQAHFWEAHFADEANFPEARFANLAQFTGTQFHRGAIFVEAQFGHGVQFRKAVFGGQTFFTDAKFDNFADFEGSQFDSLVSFVRVQFNGRADFREAQFDQWASFMDAKFLDEADFRESHFDSLVYFLDTRFSNKVNFGGTQFGQMTSFSNTQFDREIDFRKARFGKQLNLIRTTFNQEVDFRQAHFDATDEIYLEDFAFPEGKLRLYWSQFRGTDNLRIRISLTDSERIGISQPEHYTRIEIIYHLLRDNFLKQGDQASADEVMYELGWQREEISKEGWWKLYGWTFGYGYQPWRFLVFVVLPFIVIFSLVWHWKYYRIVLDIVDKDHGLYGTDIKGKVKWFSRYWHVLHFSAAVLLGIRFRKEWIKDSPHTGRINTFVTVVTAEWGLGIGLYVVFALLAKGHRLAYIKGLLGF